MNERLEGSWRRKRPSLSIQELSSDSDSDCVVQVTHKRKKINVIESESSDDSSSSSVIGVRNSKLRRKMTRMWHDNESCSQESSGKSSSEENSSYDSESGNHSAESYESCDNTDEEVMVQAAIEESLATVCEPTQSLDEEANECPVVNTQSNAGSFTSDSSSGQSEKCAICLISFSIQEVGSPEKCDHSFCSLCIQEWAKVVNTCPIDRQTFTSILVRKRINGKVIKKIPVEAQEATDTQELGIELDSDPTLCEVCGQGDREDRLLLCDGCDLGYHLECLDPPIEYVPVEEWFCPNCASDQNLSTTEDVEMPEGELSNRLDAVVHMRPGQSRLLQQTIQSERVRTTITYLHQESQHQNPNILYVNGTSQGGFFYSSDSD